MDEFTERWVKAAAEVHRPKEATEKRASEVRVGDRIRSLGSEDPFRLVVLASKLRDASGYAEVRIDLVDDQGKRDTTYHLPNEWFEIMDWREA